VAEVIVEGRRLDVMEGLDFSFNYSIADVRDPNKRSTDYSKTIKCPATKSNDELFGNIWEVNISNPNDPNSTNIEANFNPNKKAEARVLADGVEVMVGVVQLRAINILNGRYDYEVVFIGKLKNIFSVIGDKQLNDVDETGDPYVDFSYLDHTFGETNVVNSWSNTTGYVYPMIDYGIRFEYDIDGNRIYDIETWRPAVYLKDIVDRIFDFAGFTYTSAFLDSAPFTKLIVPFHSEDFVLNDDQIAARQFTAKADADLNIWVAAAVQTIGNFQYYIKTLEFKDVSDPSGIWDDTAYLFEPQDTGFYSLTTNTTFTVTRTGIDTSTGFLSGHIRLKRLRNSVISVVDSVPFSLDLPNILGIGEVGTTVVNWSTQPDLYYPDDDVWIEVATKKTDVDGLSAFYTAVHKTDSTLFNSVTEESVFEGVQVYMNNYVPEVKMKDVLLGVFKMFNLYVTVDPLNETNLIIETRDEYYSGGTVRDWTQKLARDKKINIKPLALLTGKEYIYTYDSDDDYYNTRYENARGDVYGTRRLEIDNDFLNNNNTVSIAFSATPISNDGSSNRIIPQIYDADIDNGATPTDINMRVLYYDGLIDSTPKWIMRHNQQQNTDDYTVYPYAGHLDNPITPSIDLNFGIPKQLFYTSNGYTGTLQYTNANLFNVYHRSHINEITDKDAKVFTGEFYLTPWDLQKLDFRDQIIIDNCYWRLNKINDYNPFKDGLTKVELFKVLDVVPQEFETFTLGSSGTVGNGGEKEDLPYDRKRSKSNFNMFPVGKGSVNGKQNRVSQDANNFKIVGDDNFIGGGSNKVSIFGNGNQVLFGASNVVIINSDNQVVADDNVTIIDGHRTWRYVNTTSDYTASDREVVLVNATLSVSDITITLPTLADNLWVCVKRLNGLGGNTDITAGVSGNVEGVGTYTLTSQYESVELYCDGSNWHIRSNA